MSLMTGSARLRRPASGIVAIVVAVLVMSACQSRGGDDASASPSASEGLSAGLEVDPKSAFGLPKLLGLEPILQDETLVLDAKDSPIDAATILNQDACDPADPDRVPCEFELTFSAVPDGLEKGSVLASDVAPALPHGLLVKVASVDDAGAGATVRATEATLGDALEQGEFVVERQFTAADVASVELAPGVTATGTLAQATASAGGFGQGRGGHGLAAFIPDATLPGDAAAGLRTGDGGGLGFGFAITNVELTEGVVANGFVGFDVGCGAYGGLTWKKYLGVPVYPNGVYFEAKCGATQDGNITITADRKATVEESKQIASINLDAITFWVGPVPVVLIPTVTVTANMSGQVEANMTFGASEHFGAQAGINYNKGFHLIKDFSFDFDSTASNVSTRLTARAGVEVGEALMLYGLAGPQLTQEIYAQLEANPAGTSPIWCLTGGIDAGVALNVDLGFDTLRYGPETLYEKTIELGCAANQAPTARIQGGDQGITVFPTSTFQPPDVIAYGDDPEQGSLPVTWASDGVTLGTSASGQRFSLASLKPGTHTVTATVTDGEGATATATAIVTAKDSTPTSQILVKDGSGNWVDGASASGTTGGQIVVKVVSKTPLGLVVGECMATTWSGGLTVDYLSGCEHRINLTKAGTFPLTATVTDPDGKKVTDAITVTVTNPAPGSPPSFTEIGAIRTNPAPYDPLCDGCAIDFGGQVALQTFYTNSAAAGKSVKYVWDYTRTYAGTTSAWTTLAGSDPSPQSSSTRVFNAPSEWNKYYVFTFRVRVVDATSSTQYYQDTFTLVYQGPPA